MPTYITTRKLPKPSNPSEYRKGDRYVRYDVRYRKGGRGYKLERAGSFKTRREAETRENLVADWLSRNLDPAAELARLNAPAPSKVTTADVAKTWIPSRLDTVENTQDNYRCAMLRIDRVFTGNIFDITPGDVTAWIVAMAEEGLAPGTVRLYVGVLRQLLDTGLGEAPNPARHRSVKLPKKVRSIKEPPTAEDYLALLAALPVRWQAAVVMLEQTGMRINEALAVEERDIDRAGSRILVSRSKTERPRWVPIPEWYAAIVEPLAHLNDLSLANAMRYHSERIGIKRIHPHLLRHRRATLWHQSGVVAVELASRLGNRVGEALETYSHVRPIHEADPSRVLQILGEEPLNVGPADEEFSGAGDFDLRDLLDNGLGAGSFEAGLLHDLPGVH